MNFNTHIPGLNIELRELTDEESQRELNIDRFNEFYNLTNLFYKHQYLFFFDLYI